MAQFRQRHALPSPRLPLGARVIPGASLALALTALLTSLVHMGVVRHERCAEHGELVEVAGPVTHGSAERALAESSVAALTALEDEERDHDHCALATTSALPSVPGVLESALTIDAPLVTTSAPPLLLVAHDVLDVAPKTSPPALA